MIRVGKSKKYRLTLCMSHEIPRHWRLKKQRYGLVGEKCSEGHYLFPPRDICPDCHGEISVDPLKVQGGDVFDTKTISSSAKETSMSSK